MKKFISVDKIIIACLILGIAFSASACSISKQVSEKSRVISPVGIINLQMGIKSANQGLRKSSIYYAGLYQIKETAAGLISQLAEEKETDTKLLITLALYKIGTKECIEAIEKFSDSEKNSNLKRVALSMLYHNETDKSKR